MLLQPMDKFTKEKRSAIMRAIRSRDTLPEIVVRKWLHANGWRFRCQYKKVPGHPDIALPKIRTLIEIRGCFWHRHENCPAATMPKTNLEFWRTKFRNNVERDRRHEREWKELGWNLIVIWECGLAPQRERERTFRKVAKWLKEISEASR